jgi:hypothetical protein
MVETNEQGIPLMSPRGIPTTAGGISPFLPIQGENIIKV